MFPYTREGKFFVNGEDISFEMLSAADLAKLDLMLSGLSSNNEKPYDKASQLADRNFYYDYSTLLGFDDFTKGTGLAGAWLIGAEEALKDPSHADSSQGFTLTDQCSSSITKYKDSASKKSLNTKTLNSTIGVDGNGVYTSTISASMISAASENLRQIYNNCFAPDNVLAQMILKSLTARPTSGIEIKFYQKDSHWFLTMGGDLTQFEIWDLNDPSAKQEGAVSSAAEPRNSFGLAFAFCKVPPVRGAGLTNTSYDFWAETYDYSLPPEAHINFCTTSNAETVGYSTPTIQSVFEKSLRESIIIYEDATIELLASVHDLRYEIEKFNTEKGRYPAKTELKTLMENISAHQDTLKTYVSNAAVEYTPTPANCSTNCQDYSIITNTTEVSLTSRSYATQPQPAQN